MLTNVRGHVSQVLGQTVTATASHGSQEGTMSPTKRYAKKQAKASQRRRLTVQERLERDRLQAQHAATVLEQALHDLGLPQDLVTEIEGRLRSQQQLLGKIVGMMCPPCLGVAPTPNCAACGVGTRIYPPACSGHCPSGPGSSDSDAWAWRC